MPRKVYEKPEDFKKRMQQSGEAKERAKANMYLTGGQAKIAAKAPPPNKIDEKDFAVLRAEKAKGRGMGLQDESVKPGKVMKAKRGTGIKLPKEGSRLTFSGYSKPFEGPQHKGRVSTIVGVKPGAKIKGQRKKFKSMDEMRKAKGFKPGESAAEFNKRRMKLGAAGRALAATRIGKIALGVGAAGVAAEQYLKSKMKKDKNKKTLKDFREQKKPGIPSEKTKTINSALNKLNKKMNGGMMKKYSVGGNILHKLKSQKELKKITDSEEYKSADYKGKTEMLGGKVRTQKEMESRMGGGMMKKPMGYSTGRSISTRGGGVDSSIIGRIRDAGPFKRIPLGKSRLTDEDRKKIRGLMQQRSSRKKALDTAKRVASTVASVASPVTAAASAAYKLAKKMKDKDRLTDRDIDKAKSLVGRSGSKNRPIRKNERSRNPNPKTPKMMGGGMMMQRPMGYNKGVMVKARGCKLGRTRPTKIT